MKDRKSLLSAQIKIDLLNIFHAGAFKAEDKLPTETELAAALHVSRSTIRAALEALASCAVIKRIKGSGTFLLKPKPVIDLDLNDLFKLSDVIEDAGYRMKTISLKVESAKAERQRALILNIKENEEIILFERVRSLADEPAVYSIDTVPKSLLPSRYTLENMGNSLSEFLGVHIADAKARIFPVKANAKVSEALRVPPNTLCLMLEEITYDTRGTPIDYSHEYYLSHLFHFDINRVKRVKK